MNVKSVSIKTFGYFGRKSKHLPDFQHAITVMCPGLAMARNKVLIEVAQNADCSFSAVLQWFSENIDSNKPNFNNKLKSMFLQFFFSIDIVKCLNETTISNINLRIYILNESKQQKQSIAIVTFELYFLFK